jgi:proton-translocating NADH-quinone oxidoreductase chain N
MSSIYFIAIPLLFGFSVPIFSKLGKNGVAYISLLMQLSLFLLSINIALNLTTPIVEVIAIAPPLGIGLVVDRISIFFVLLFTFLTLMVSIYYMGFRDKNPYENENKFFILLNMLLASTVGLVLSSDIFNIYVFFEIAGISAYILSSYQKTPKALESGLKYLLTGAIASIFLVFAIFLIYLHLGTLNLALISQNFYHLSNELQLLIATLLLIGFGFKVEIFPLNFWVSDIYEGSSSLVNALFSSMVSKAYLFVFFHILYLLLPHHNFTEFLLYMGLVSMLIAEIVALKQTNIKRVFAYSSLGQLGLLFIAFSLQNAGGVEAGLYIILAHSLAKMVIFLSISLISNNYNSEDIGVLSKVNSPFIKWTLVISMLSLLGIPLFAGFIGKFWLLKSLSLEAAYFIIGAILVASLIEAIYYFKLIGLLFEKRDNRDTLYISALQKIVLSILTILIILVGVAPYLISDWINLASSVMLNSHEYQNIILGVSL